MTTAAPEPNERELIFARVIAAAPSAVYRCWTEPALLVQWFTPAPWRTIHAETDVRAGGSNLVIMQSPEGQEYPQRGLYLEVKPNEKLVVTDAFTSAWEPSDRAFTTMILTFSETAGGHTAYTARVLYWTAEACREHEQMGFHAGWGKAAEQLEALAQTL